MSNNGRMPQNCSLLQRSLLLKVYMTIISEIKGDKNTWFAGEHFHNDPREHPGERFLHFIENVEVSKIIDKIKEENSDLVYKPGSLTKKSAVAA